MKTKYTVALSLLAGVAIGAVAVQGLHAQAAKLKAYSVSELEVKGTPTTESGYFSEVRKAIKDHHGTALKTTAGRVFKVEGAEPPKNVAIVEWESADDALGFYKSEVWNSMKGERDKIYTTIRRYVVEIEK